MSNLRSAGPIKTARMPTMEGQFQFVPRLIVRVIGIAILCLQVTVTPERVQAQQSQPPIEKERLLKSLQKQIVPIELLERELKTHGVGFPLTPETEVEIRRAGHYLGKPNLDQLIDLVRDNHRPVERLRVSLFKYEPCEKGYDDFARMLTSKITNLPSMLITRDRRLSYSAGLNLVKEEKPFNMSLLRANEYLEETQSLQLLQGMCTPKGNDVLMISQVFLGDLRGPLAPIIRIEFKVTEDEFSRTKDMHSLLILYSLAKDAQARGLRRELVIAYLSEARGIAIQIKDVDDPAILQSINSAIQVMLRELGAGDLAVLPRQ